MKRSILVLFIMFGVIYLNPKVYAKSFDFKVNIIDTNNNIKESREGQAESLIVSARADSGDGNITVRVNGGELEEFNLAKYNQDIIIKFESKMFFDIIVESFDFKKDFNYELVSLKDFEIRYTNRNFYVYYKNNLLDGNVELFYIKAQKASSRPVIDGQEIFVSNVDSPKTLEQIREIINLRAIDGYEGDITSSIRIVSNEYEGNEEKVGTYKVLFSVKNKSGQEARFTLNITVRDNVAPRIIGPSSAFYGYKTSLTMDEIISLYEVTDNYDNNLELVPLENNYNKDVIGKYIINFEAVDSSGNKATQKLEMNIVDDVNPEITDIHKGVIKVNYDKNIDERFLLEGLTAYDEIDKDLTDQIKIVRNNIRNQLGIYSVLYEVVDKSGNKKTHARQYQIVNEDFPVFWISESTLTIENVNELTYEQIIKILSDLNHVNVSSYEVINDTYTGNEKEEGMYKITFRITNDNNETYDYEQNINVFDMDSINPITKQHSYTPYIVIFSVSVVLISGILIRKKIK